MPGTEDRLSRTVTAIAAVISLIVALGGPVNYFESAYDSLAVQMETAVAIRAQTVSRMIGATGEHWVFQKYRLEELLRRDLQVEGGLTTVVGKDGEVVLALGTAPESPTVRRAATLYDVGTAVGEVVEARSLRPIVSKTAGVAVLSAALAAAIFVVLRLLPIRALNRVIAVLKEERERALVTLHSIGDAVITTDDGQRVTYLNPAAEKLTGWASADAAGRPLAEILRLVSERTREPTPNPLAQALAEKRRLATPAPAALQRRDGSLVSIEDSAAPIVDAARRILGGVLVLRDVSESRTLARQLSWQASHDALTGLFNRKEFGRRLQDAVETARTLGKHHALCYIDLDQFKVVNDTCGHAAGDELLRQVSALLASRTRGSDLLARLGGDEFGLLLMGCPPAKAEEIAAELLKAIGGLRFGWHDKLFRIGASVGISPVSPDCAGANEAMIAADDACFGAKEAGRNRVHVYRADDEAAARRAQMSWIAKLSSALEKDRFALYCQPYLGLAADTIGLAHRELLVRMIDDEGAHVAPGAFIPAAERYGLMPAIDRWVVRHAFHNHGKLRVCCGAEDGTLSINLSGTSFSEGQLARFILDEARAAGADPSRFCFEITETAAVNQLARASALIRELRAAGFRFALDDFGAGMSSFGYLKNLPVDFLKIDGSFVRDVARDPVSRSMVAAIHQVGHAMGIRTIAEFVDTAEVLEHVRAIGVDFAQGYFIARPAPCTLAAAAGARPAAAAAAA